MRITAQTAVRLELEQGEARDLLHDLTKDGRENRTNSKKLVQALKSMLPGISQVKSGEEVVPSCNTCGR